LVAVFGLRISTSASFSGTASGLPGEPLYRSVRPAALSSPNVGATFALLLVKGERERWLQIKEAFMNWDQIEGKWKQYSGKLRERWGKLTDDDLARIHGRREQLVGKLQERYGIAKDQAEQQIDEFTRSLTPADVDRDSKRVRGAGR
jgi:uncharacterized protein YjbJ (UPF0337 family)